MSLRVPKSSRYLNEFRDSWWHAANAHQRGCANTTIWYDSRNVKVVGIGSGKPMKYRGEQAIVAMYVRVENEGALPMPFPADPHAKPNNMEKKILDDIRKYRSSLLPEGVVQEALELL